MVVSDWSQSISGSNLTTVGADATSVAATALFPILRLALTQLGEELQIGSIVLIMVGTMWYVLFNVRAGAQSIPSDWFKAARV